MTHPLLLALLLGTLGALATPVRAQGADVEALTLEQSVALALEHNPAVTIEQERVRAAEAEYAMARSALLPKLSGSAYYNRLDPDRMSPVSLPSAPGAEPPELYVDEAYAGVRLRQVVLDGSSWPALGAASDAIDAQRSSVVASQSETIYAVTLAWTRLVEADSLINVAREAVKRQAAFESLTKALYEAGKGSRLDMLKAESQRMDAERALHAAEQTEGLAQALLRRTLGVATDRPVRAQGELSSVLEAAPSEDAVLASAVADNPQLQRFSAQARQADAAVWAAWGEHFPELSLQASYGYRYRDVGGDAGEYAAGAFLEVPLFSGLATDAVVKRAESRRRELKAARAAYEEQLRLDVRQALTSWRIAVESARFASKSIEVGREAVAAAGALYESGKATALDVLTAQTDLTRAEGTLVQALGDFATARASVERVTGKRTNAEAHR